MSVSIIIRTKNEAEWIGKCLDRIAQQQGVQYEVIVVDNDSTDETLSIVEKHSVPCQVVHYKERFFPGKSLNLGCQAASGEVLAFISAHCLPIDSDWLSNLVRNLDDPAVAGVYGKQEPMEMTSPIDKRDLILTFGLDRKVQWEDPFFHNANSAIPTALWKELPFHEELTNIEDRIWAANMQKRGKCIVYEPTSRVFHFHGIHQSHNRARVEGVNRIIEKMDAYIEEPPLSEKFEKQKIFAVLPYSTEISSPGMDQDRVYRMIRRNLLTLSRVPGLDQIALLIDSEDMAMRLREEVPGLAIPYIRPKQDQYTLLQVLSEFVNKQKIHDDDSILLGYGNVVATGREESLERIVREYLGSEAHSAIWVEKKFNPIFRKTDDRVYRMDEGIVSHRGYKIPFLEGLQAWGSVIRAKNIREGYFHNENVLLLERDPNDFSIVLSDDHQVQNLLDLVKEVSGSDE